jgi:hypothetical protein
VNRLCVDDKCDDLSKRYGSCRAPTRQEIGGHCESDLLAEEAQGVRRKTFDLLAQMRGRAELGHAQARFYGRPDGTFGSVDQKEPPLDEVRYVAARPTHLPKDIEQATAEIVAGIGVEVSTGLWRSNTDEQHSDGCWRLATWRIQEAWRTFDPY